MKAALLIALAGAIGALVAFALHGGFRRHSDSHAGPRHHGHSEAWDDDAPAEDAPSDAEPPAEFLGAPVAEPWIGVLVGDVVVEPTLPPLPSFTPNWEPHACPDVAAAAVWTPPHDPDLREFADVIMAGPARSALGSWVDDMLASPPAAGLGYLQPAWRDGGWAA